MLKPLKRGSLQQRHMVSIYIIYPGIAHIGGILKPYRLKSCGEKKTAGHAASLREPEGHTGGPQPFGPLCENGLYPREASFSRFDVLIEAVI